MPSLQVKEVGVTNFGGRLPLTAALEKLLAPWSGLLIRVLGGEGHSLLILRYTTPEKQPMVLWSISWPAKASDQEAQAEWRRVKAQGGKDEDTDSYSVAERAFLVKVQKEVQRRAELHFKEPQVQTVVSTTPVELLFAPQTVKSMETPPPPSAYSAPSRVFLLGDAAHAMYVPVPRWFCVCRRLTCII